MDGLGLHPAPPSRSPLSARPFGPQVLLGELIGRGGMSRVYRGWVRGTGREVAVKVLRDDLASRPEAVQRFVRERDLLAAVASPHVVRVHDLVVSGDELGIVMDLVPGGHLRKAVDFPSPPAVAAELTAQIADGLAAVHATGVIHRDLKPENVLVDRDDDGAVRLRLTDFGISRLVDAQLTSTAVTGTPGYLAPEVAAGGRVTAAGDLYALGVILYELCTGRGPFVADNPLVLILAHTRMEPPRPAGMPDDLWAVLAAMLAKDPLARPAAAAVASSLRVLVPALAGLPMFEPPEAQPAPDLADLPPGGYSQPSPGGHPGVPGQQVVPGRQSPYPQGPHTPGQHPGGAYLPGQQGHGQHHPGMDGVQIMSPGDGGPSAPRHTSELQPLSRRAAMLAPGAPGGPRGHGRSTGPGGLSLPGLLGRPWALVVGATVAVLLVVLAALGLRSALVAGPAPAPAPTVALPTAGPTTPDQSLVEPGPPPSQGVPRTVSSTAPAAATSASPSPTRSAAASPSPTPTVSPGVPSLARQSLSAADRHSSDEHVDLTVSGIDPGAGSTLQSVAITYDGDRTARVPLVPPGASSYDVSLDGLTNGRSYSFTAEVCNDAGACATSAPFEFTPYGAPDVHRPKGTVSGLSVTVVWQPVDSNSNPGTTTCLLTVVGSPSDPAVSQPREVGPDGGSLVFTGKAGTTYLATQTCSTDDVPDGSATSAPIVVPAATTPTLTPTTTTPNTSTSTTGAGAGAAGLR